MKPPRSVRVGPYTFRVVRTPNLIAGTNLGDTNPGRARIRYTTRGLCPMQVRALLLHETLHAVAHTASIRDEDTLTQEEWISRVEPVLLGVLRDNPRLLRYLTAA